MTRRSVLLATVLLLAGILFVPRIVHHAGMPEFEPGVTLLRRPQLLIEGLSIACPVENGRLSIQAGAAAPGHERFGPMALGPSTFLELAEVEIEFVARSGKVLRARAERGEFRPGELRLTEGVKLTRPNERERECSRMTVDLDSGRVSLRR